MLLGSRASDLFAAPLKIYWCADYNSTLSVPGVLGSANFDGSNSSIIRNGNHDNIEGCFYNKTEHTLLFNQNSNTSNNLYQTSSANTDEASLALPTNSVGGIAIDYRTQLL